MAESFPKDPGSGKRDSLSVASRGSTNSLVGGKGGGENSHFLSYPSWLPKKETVKAKENAALQADRDERGAWVSAPEEFPALGNHPYGW